MTFTSLLSLTAVVVIGCALSAPVFAADQSAGAGYGRYRYVAPVPHVRVVCFDRAQRKIACADSARVAAQVAHYGACPGCAPVVLPPSRFSGYYYWW